MEPRILDPWERQPYDTDESWEAFKAYRDQNLPRRKRYLTVKGRPVDPIKVADWMERHYWEQRAAEYDRRLDAIDRSEREAMLAQTSREVAAEWMSVLADGRMVVRDEMRKLLATVQESSGERVRHRDLIRLMEMLIRQERLLRGESTDKVEIKDLSHLTDEEIDRRLKLIEELEAQEHAHTSH